ncbi:MAG: CPBP family intramembrane glutamic endopeptidase [Chitinophagaceae bacterium]
MRKILSQLYGYWWWLDKGLFVYTVFFVTTLVFCNYYFGINRTINANAPLLQYLCWYLLFLLAFSFPYIVAFTVRQKRMTSVKWLPLLFIAPAIFSWKMTYAVNFHFSDSVPANIYWNTVVYWPFKLVIIVMMLGAVWLASGKRAYHYGLGNTNFSYRPYVTMLLLMTPLIAAAATQPDFLALYPKLKSLQNFPTAGNHGWYQLLYELCYGSDFFGIELFFRGFLILGFARWTGKDCILPMAVFYCTIHFGKPLAECISSFFGGLILGVVTYHSRSIWGGLLVHLGIAWLMELGGYLGRVYAN